MDEPEFRMIVNGVVDQFQAQVLFTILQPAGRQTFNLRITVDGREELIQPGIPHLTDVTAGLSTGRITIERMQEAVGSILQDTLDMMEADPFRWNIFQSPAWRFGSTVEIRQDPIRESMRRKCPYLFWC